jgi:hypothetical protein
VYSCLKVNGCHDNQSPEDRVRKGHSINYKYCKCISQDKLLTLGSLVVIVLAVGPKFRGFKLD